MILKEADGRDDDIREIEDLARAHPHIRYKAEDNIKRIRSGLSGEESAAHFLNREFRDSKRVAVLHDIRLACGDDDYAQIDHLLIHRVQGTAWILETKSYSGDLSCNEHGEWVVFYNRRPTAVPSPVEQAKRQAIALERWLKQRGIKGINRIIPVVLTNPRGHVSRKHLRADDHVVKSDNFARWYQDASESIGAGKALAMMGRFLVSGMDEIQMRLLGRKICDAHEPAKFNWPARLGVSDNKMNRTNDQPTFRMMGRAIVFDRQASGAYRYANEDPELHSAFLAGALGRDAGTYSPKGGHTGILTMPAAMMPELQDRMDALYNQDERPSVALASTGRKDVRPTRVLGQTIAASMLAMANVKTEIETPLGKVRTQPLPDGRIALRAQGNPNLEKALSAACRGQAKWEPRYRNWIITAAQLPSIIANIK